MAQEQLDKLVTGQSMCACTHYVPVKESVHSIFIGSPYIFVNGLRQSRKSVILCTIDTVHECTHDYKCYSIYDATYSIAVVSVVHTYACGGMHLAHSLC